MEGIDRGCINVAQCSVRSQQISFSRPRMARQRGGRPPIREFTPDWAENLLFITVSTLTVGALSSGI